MSGTICGDMWISVVWCFFQKEVCYVFSLKCCVDPLSRNFSGKKNILSGKVWRCCDTTLPCCWCTLVHFGVTTPACPMKKQAKFPTATLCCALGRAGWPHVTICEANTLPPADRSPERLSCSESCNLVWRKDSVVTFAWDYICGGKYQMKKKIKNYVAQRNRNNLKHNSRLGFLSHITKSLSCYTFFFFKQVT